MSKPSERSETNIWKHRNISIKSFVINKFTYDLKLKDEKEIQLEINKSAKCTFQDESRSN